MYLICSSIIEIDSIEKNDTGKQSRNVVFGCIQIYNYLIPNEVLEDDTLLVHEFIWIRLFWWGIATRLIDWLIVWRVDTIIKYVSLDSVELFYQSICV